MKRYVIACALLVWTSAARSTISVSKDGVSFAHCSAGSDGELFVACAEAPDDQQYGLSRMALTLGSDGVYSAQLAGLLQEKVCINAGAVVDSKNKHLLTPVFSDNPIRGQRIGELSACKHMPLVLFGATTTSMTNVALIQDPTVGRLMLLARKPFADATGAACRNIVAVAGGTNVLESSNKLFASTELNLVFAAVTPSDDATFTGQAAAGIAVAQIIQGSEFARTDGIMPLNASGSSSGPQAAALTTDMIQVGGEGAVVSVKALVWNPVLKKVFVALETADAGCALVVGSLAVSAPHPVTKQITARLALAPVVSDADPDDADHIVVHSAEGVTLEHLGIMNTSTGFSYAIVARNDDGVYAVPLTSDGVLAQKSAIASAATRINSDQLLLPIDAAAQVGGGDDAPTTVTQLTVQGDAVLISCAGGDPLEQGVFCSQALFNSNGEIVGWTRWQRVVSGVGAVHGFARDPIARFRFLGGDSDTINAQVWGCAGGNDVWGGTPDSEELGLMFKVNNFLRLQDGGVSCVKAVASASFGWHDTSPQLAADTSMLLIGGRNRLCIAVTMKEGAVATGADFNDSVFFWSIDLSDYGLSLDLITAAALSRSDADAVDNEGWLFVGGVNGAAILSQSTGEGFSELSDISVFGDDEYTFKMLKKADGSDFSGVRCIKADANNVYILCEAGLYRIPYDADAFKATSPGPLGETLIASAAELLNASYETLLSLEIVNDSAFLATTKGLWVTATALGDVADQRGEGGWQEVPVVAETEESFGVCVGLLFAESRDAEHGGMLYVMTSDISFNIASVYRIAVPDMTAFDDDARAALQAVVHHDTQDRVYLSLLGQCREYFYTDGGYLFDASSQHHIFFEEGNGLLRMLPLSSRAGDVDAWLHSASPRLSEARPGAVVTGIERDFATGTLIASGLWGLQILQ